jgi:drug/metabolite transporter (DMT)-like permease
MQIADRIVLRFSPLIVVVAAVVYNLSLDHLLGSGYSSSSVLVYRGVITLLITVVFAFGARQSVLPGKLHLQVVRLLNSGIGLLAAFEAYKGLTASTVAMVSRMDIPIAVLMGFVAGKRKKDFRVGLSVFAICLVLSILFFSGTINEDRFSLVLAIVAVAMISVSYLLIKRSTRDENNFTIVNTTTIGCLIVGLISGVLRGNLGVLHLADLWVFFLASLSQFALNYTSAVVYRNKDVERAQRPYLAGALVVLVVEQLLAQRFFEPLLVAYILVVVSVIFVITLKRLPGRREVVILRQWLGRLQRLLATNPLIVRSIE